MNNIPQIGWLASAFCQTAPRPKFRIEHKRPVHATVQNMASLLAKNLRYLPPVIRKLVIIKYTLLFLVEGCSFSHTKATSSMFLLHENKTDDSTDRTHSRLMLAFALSLSISIHIGNATIEGIHPYRCPCLNRENAEVLDGVLGDIRHFWEKTAGWCATALCPDVSA